MHTTAGALSDPSVRLVHVEVGERAATAEGQWRARAGERHSRSLARAGAASGGAPRARACAAQPARARH